jgi:hypothetical protein
MNLFKRHQKEQQLITEFKEAFMAYTLLDRKDYLTDAEKELQFKLREKLNNMNGEVGLYVHKAGISASITYTPPPMIGGLVRNIDFFSNLFNLSQFSIAPQLVVDSLDRAIGNYNVYNNRFTKKLINPIYWVGELIRVPFHIAHFAGFDENKLEFSLFGKIYKFTSSILIFIATILTILNYVGINTKLNVLGKSANSSQSSPTAKNSPSTVSDLVKSGQTPSPREKNK